MIDQSCGERPTRCLTRASVRAAGRSRVACGPPARIAIRAHTRSTIRPRARLLSISRMDRHRVARTRRRGFGPLPHCRSVSPPSRERRSPSGPGVRCGVGNGAVPRRPEYMVGGRRPVRRAAPRTSTRPLSVTRHRVGRIDDTTAGRLAQCRIDAARIERRTDSANDDVVGQHTGAGSESSVSAWRHRDPARALSRRAPPRDQPRDCASRAAGLGRSDCTRRKVWSPMVAT